MAHPRPMSLPVLVRPNSLHHQRSVLVEALIRTDWPALTAAADVVCGLDGVLTDGPGQGGRFQSRFRLPTQPVGARPARRCCPDAARPDLHHLQRLQSDAVRLWLPGRVPGLDATRRHPRFVDGIRWHARRAEFANRQCVVSRFPPVVGAIVDAETRAGGLAIHARRHRHRRHPRFALELPKYAETLTHWRFTSDEGATESEPIHLSRSVPIPWKLPNDYVNRRHVSRYVHTCWNLRQLLQHHDDWSRHVPRRVLVFLPLNSKPNKFVLPWCRWFQWPPSISDRIRTDELGWKCLRSGSPFHVQRWQRRRSLLGK